MIKNRFFKTTLGYFAELAIVKALDVSNAAAQQPNLQAFITNALAGTLGVFFADTNLAVAAGDTALAANAKRSIFYAWKQADGTLKTSTPIPVAGLKYQSVAFNAGTAQVRTATFGGAYAVGQIVHIKVIETTGTHLPFPIFQYEAKVGAGGINDVVTALAAAINAEKADNDPVVTAAAAANVLTITSKTKTRNFKLSAYVEVTGAQPNDDSAIVFAETAKQVHPIGDVATMKELEDYATHNSGGITRTNSMLNAEEFGEIASNLDTTGATQYGFVLVTSDRVEKGGVMNPALNHTARILVAIQTADVAALAGK